MHIRGSGAGESAPLACGSTVTTCAKGPKEKKTAIFGVLPVRRLQKLRGRFCSDAVQTRSFTGPCRGLSLPGALSLPGVLSSRGWTLEDSQCLASVSPWEALLCPRLPELRAISGRQGLGSQPGWHSRWGPGAAAPGGEEGAEGL